MISPFPSGGYWFNRAGGAMLSGAGVAAAMRRA
jgi:hypothetical protein